MCIKLNLKEKLHCLPSLENRASSITSCFIYNRLQIYSSQVIGLLFSQNFLSSIVILVVIIIAIFCKNFVVRLLAAQSECKNRERIDDKTKPEHYYFNFEPLSSVLLMRGASHSFFASNYGHSHYTRT